MSQTALATAVGLTRDTIASYENGRLYPSIEVLKTLAFLFDCELEIKLKKTLKKEK